MSTPETTYIRKHLFERLPEQSRRWWLLPQPFDAVTTSLSLGVLALFFRMVLLTDPASRSRLLSWWGLLLLIGATIGLLAIDRLEYRFYGEHTPRRVAVVLLAVRLLLTEVVVELTHMNLSPFLYLLLPFRAWLYFGGVAGTSLAGLLWVRCMSGDLFNRPFYFVGPLDETVAAIFTLGMLFALTMARVVQNEKASRIRAEQLSVQLEQANRQLKASVEQVAELAAAKERNRLARDIHDSLGHYLTATHVQLEKALAFRDQQPPVAEQALRAAKRLTSEALQDVRRSVSALRMTQQPFAFVLALQALVEQTRAGHCEVDLEIRGQEEGFSPLRLLTLYRVAQEGLTNVQKHACARHIWIEVWFAEQEAHLSLRDDGRGFDPTERQNEQQGGYGLLGLAERLELVGGRLEVESKLGGGTRLLAFVPRER